MNWFQQFSCAYKLFIICESYRNYIAAIWDTSGKPTIWLCRRNGIHWNCGISRSWFGHDKNQHHTLDRPMRKRTIWEKANILLLDPWGAQPINNFGPFPNRVEKPSDERQEQFVYKTLAYLSRQVVRLDRCPGTKVVQGHREKFRAQSENYAENRSPEWKLFRPKFLLRRPEQSRFGEE